MTTIHAFPGSPERLQFQNQSESESENLVPSPPDQSLLIELRNDHHRNFGWSLACCGWQQELAEDVLQESYLRVLDQRAQFSGRASARTWFFAVIKRVAGEIRRRQERRDILNLKVVAGSDETLLGGADPQPTESEVQQDQTSEHLRAALMQLSTRQREVLHLVFYSEFTLEQAAEALDISIGSVRTHYHRGKLQLAQLLELDTDHDE